MYSTLVCFSLISRVDPRFLIGIVLQDNSVSYFLNKKWRKLLPGPGKRYIFFVYFVPETE
jgi:hypothetical protein